MSFAQKEQNLLKQKLLKDQPQVKIEKDAKMQMLDMKNNLQKFKELLTKIKYSKDNKHALLYQSKAISEDISDQIIQLKTSKIENLNDQQYAMNFLKEYIQVYSDLRDQQKQFINQQLNIQRESQNKQQSQNQPNLQNQQMVQKQQQQQNFMDDFLMQRDQEIEETYWKTKQLKEIMKDIQETVVDQGSYINTLEDYILKSQQYTNKSCGELQKLDEKKKMNCRYTFIQSYLLFDMCSDIRNYHCLLRFQEL